MPVLTRLNWRGEAAGFSIQMVEHLMTDTFYIIVPDNETSEEVDKARMEWAMQDITEDRAPLSRWHLAYKDEFEAFLNARIERARLERDDLQSV